ncbi:iron-siderophore ABC transporter substrate-binding protein [Paenibacillus sp. PL2-23]|uniref:ABC transporter substrate-binding protein n=1 Tax=Paenibacillus sp. PL2-23 TaxID=2100729 RepID=UPI0030FC9C61
MLNRNRRSFVTIISLILILALAACGNNTNNGNSGNAAGTASPAASETAPEATAANEERVIQHALGETPITGIPQKIVVLEWTYAEDLLALGVQPAGVADIDNMKKWMKTPVELAADVQDVGTRQEPNLETITALEPDLIIGVTFRHEAIKDQLSAIAPTIMFNPYPAEGSGDQYQEMVDTFNTIATVVDKTEEAEAVLADLQKAYDDAKAKIVAAGKDGQPIVLAMPLVNQNAVSFRISTDNALAIKVLEHIGLTNAYQSEQFEVYGFATKDIEAFPPLQDADFLHITMEEAATDMLSKNAVWNGLRFVQDNRAYALGGDTWPYGGPHSAKMLAERVASVLSGE